jgi:outer membrane protein assembly factor BamB
MELQDTVPSEHERRAAPGARAWCVALALAKALAACRLFTGPEHSPFVDEVWHTRLPSGSLSWWVNGRPAVADGRLYVQDANLAMALDAATGRILWSRPVRPRAQRRDRRARRGDRSPALAEVRPWRRLRRRLLRGSFFTVDGRVVRFDAATGRETGRFDIYYDASVLSDLASDGRYVYVTATDGAYAIPCR